MSIEKLLLAKLESTYDTDPTPDDSNAIETIGLEMLRYEGDKVTRDVDRHTLGGKPSININPHTSTSFSVPAAASGTSGASIAPPAHGVLWRACGFDETIDTTPSSEKVTYHLPANQADLKDAKSVTLWDYRAQAGLVQKTTGVRGSVAWTMERGQLPRFNFSNLLGTYNTPETGAEPTGIDWSVWRSELPFTKANLPILTLDGVSACVESFNIDFGLQVSRRNLPGCQQTILTGYEITGGMKIVAPTVADKDWYAKVESHAGISTVALALQYGTTPGDIILLSSAEIQISNLTEEESGDGDLAFNFELSFLDQPVITFQ